MAMRKVVTICLYLSIRAFHVFICISGPVLIVSVLLLLGFHALLYFTTLVPSYRSLVCVFVQHPRSK